MLVGIEYEPHTDMQTTNLHVHLFFRLNRQQQIYLLQIASRALI